MANGRSGYLDRRNAPYNVGAQKDFWVSNTDTNENFQISATLQYVGDNIYFWIEDGVRFNQSDLDRLASTFDQEIIPTNREFFGQEWNPGVDGDSASTYSMLAAWVIPWRLLLFGRRAAPGRPPLLQRS